MSIFFFFLLKNVGRFSLELPIPMCFNVKRCRRSPYNGSYVRHKYRKHYAHEYDETVERYNVQDARVNG